MRRQQLPLFPELPSAPSLRDVAEAVREAGLAGLPDAAERADRARYQEVHVRSAVTAAKGMPFKWALNTYRGCTHACEYCYARKYQQHLELGTGDDFSSVILVKRNVAAVLATEVTRPSWQRESVAVGTATDPYQPIEGYYRLTRQCLEVLTDAHTPFSIVTKGPMVVRDLDILVRATGLAGCRVYVSVASVDEQAWARLEPGTAPPLQRLRAARHLADAGVNVAVLMMPLVPGITTARPLVERTVDAILSSGLRLAGANVAHLEAGVRDHFLAFLAREYPDLVEAYQRLYRERKYAARSYVEAVSRVVTDARRLAATPCVSAPRPTTGSEPSCPVVQP